MAILAENGILRAETLRFADEVRAPEDVGLPDRVEPDRETVSEIREAIASATAGEVSEEKLEDRWAGRLLDRVEEKRERAEDVTRVSAEVEEAAREGEAEVIDLMEVLRRRMRGEGPEDAPEGEAPGAGSQEGGAEGETWPEDELRERTKDELYERAKELGISGRSGMTKEELIRAIRRAS